MKIYNPRGITGYLKINHERQVEFQEKLIFVRNANYELQKESAIVQNKIKNEKKLLTF